MSQERPRQFAYDGREGQTRRETIHVPRRGGGLETAEVYRVVNVATDPRLRGPALEGTLHHLASGHELACTFVYHDPAHFHFVLVVPPELAHRTLAERAALLRRLADDTDHRVPPYVERAEVVVGAAGLRAWLEEPRPDEVADAARELSAREAKLQERETRLAARAEATTSREDDLRLDRERLESLRRELEMKERELEARLDSLRERETELAELSAETTDASLDLPDTASGDLAAEVRMVEEPSLADAVEAIDDAPADAEIEDAEVDPAEVEALDVHELEEIEDEALEAPELLGPADVVDIGDDVELVDADMLEGVEVEALGAMSLPDEASGPDEEGAEATTVHQSEAPRALGGLSLAATPPDHFFTDPQVEMVAAATESETWLFARLSQGHEDAFRGDDVELLVQYLVVESYPVILLSLVDWSGSRPYVRRAALDPKSDGDRALLERLQEDFSATVAVFGPEGRFERTLEVASPERRPNLAMALDRASRVEGRGDPATALERALAAPPPVKLRGHPFDPSPPAADAEEALERVAALAKWSAPAKLDMALLALSIPREIVDERFRAILADALAHGIALPAALVSRAVSLGVAPEPGELVLRLIEAFSATSALPNHGGLGVEAAARNWELLIEAAAEHEVSLTSETHDLAWRTIAEVRGSDGPVEVDPKAIPEQPTEALVRLLEHPKVRKDAAVELLSRGDTELLAPIYRAVRKMPREEVLAVVPRVVACGEVAADALIDGLSARKTFVRQASALALGELQLRRSIAPLVHLLQTEPSDVWKEVGRVIGSFGSSALRTLTRAMRDPKGLEDRFAYTLAHLAPRAEKKVAALQQDENEAVRRIALAVVTQREAAEADARALEDEATEPSEPVLAFSWRFYRALKSLHG